jgi:hypothetical protein
VKPSLKGARAALNPLSMKNPENCRMRGLHSGYEKEKPLFPESETLTKRRESYIESFKYEKS